MKRLINNGDIFYKYVSFEDKKFRDETIKEFNWQGHRRIAGTYKGAAYSTSLADNFMADSLRNDSNPKGSLLQAAKNYTDEKVATIGGGGNLYHHAIRIEWSTREDIVFDIYNKQSEQLTFATLKTALIDTQVSCSGYRLQDGKMWHALRLYLRNTDIRVDLYTIDGATASSSVGIVGGPAVLTDLVSPVS